MMDFVDRFQSGRSELLFGHHRFVDEREALSSEMKFPSGYGWGFSEGEGKGFAESRSTTEAELVSSSESTEEDDDYIAELTRQMTHYMLHDDDKHALQTTETSITGSEKIEESWGRVGWPSDSMTVWSPFGSSRGSPEGPSQESSPTGTPSKSQAFEHRSPTYAAVLCKLDKLDMNKQGSLSGTTQEAETKNPKQVVDQSQDSKINSKQTSKKQCSINKSRQLKNISPQQFESCNQNQKKVGSCANGVLRAPLPTANLPPNLWQNNPQGPSNMKAVFLGGSGSGTRRAGTPSCGTGVFLPCVIGNTSPSPKNKRGCAPVLIPAKVVQALKVHFDRVGDLPARPNPTAFPIQKDPSKSGRGITSTSANRKRQSRGAAQPDMNDTNNNNEMGLPQEWTY